MQNWIARLTSCFKNSWWRKNNVYVEVSAVCILIFFHTWSLFCAQQLTSTSWVTFGVNIKIKGALNGVLWKDGSGEKVDSQFLPKHNSHGIPLFPAAYFCLEKNSLGKLLSLISSSCCPAVYKPWLANESRYKDLPGLDECWYQC